MLITSCFTASAFSESVRFAGMADMYDFYTTTPLPLQNPKSKNRRLYLLGNKSARSFSLLQQLYAASFAVFDFVEGSERGEGREQKEGSKSLERRKLYAKGREERVKRHPSPILNHRCSLQSAAAAQQVGLLRSSRFKFIAKYRCVGRRSLYPEDSRLRVQRITPYTHHDHGYVGYDMVDEGACGHPKLDLIRSPTTLQHG
eukprot:scaffold3384_cov122-Skeletonema_marinoi.AAC.2